MVHKIKQYLGLFFLAFIFGIVGGVDYQFASAQVVQQGTTGIPAPQLSGNGAPSGLYTCNASTAGLSYIQLDATNGRLWLCDSSSGSLAWDHQLNGIQNIVIGSSQVVGTLILGGCSSIQTVTVAGVTTTNGVLVTPIFVSSPGGNVGLLNITGWVSAANTVSIQACAFGSLTGVPNFVPKIQIL